MSVDPRLVRAVRAQLEQRPADAARVGWKVGAGDGERIGREPVAVGHLTSATVLENGATYAGGGDDLHADTELAVEVDDGGTSRYAVALEIVDLGDRGDAEGVVESNIFHRAVAFGAFAATTPQAVRARILVNGEERDAATAPEHVVDRVAGVVRVLEAVGEQVVSGDRVITGSIVQVRVASGDDVLAEIEGLGSVGLEVA